MNEDDIITNQTENLNRLNFNVLKSDLNRPWGGFFVIDENQADAFAERFFVGVTYPPDQPHIAS